MRQVYMRRRNMKVKGIGFILISVLLLSMIGCGTKTDDEFLSSLDQSIVARQNVEKKEDVQKDELVNVELGILDKFRDEKFKDKKLQKLCAEYLEGLDREKESLDLEYSEAQIAWQEGLVKCYKVLNDIYDNYYQFDDVSNFNATFIQPLDKETERLKALKAVDNDLVSQLDGVQFIEVEPKMMETSYKNNTEYNFNIEFHFTYYDSNKVRTGQSSQSFENIQSGETNNLRFNIPVEEFDTCEFFWYLDVKVTGKSSNQANEDYDENTENYIETPIPDYSKYSGVHLSEEKGGGYAGSSGKYVIDYKRKYIYNISSEQKTKLSEYFSLLDKAGYTNTKSDNDTWWVFTGNDSVYKTIVITCKEATSGYNLEILIGK